MGARNRPLESAEIIAKAADDGPVEIVKDDGGKRKDREEDDEPPTKKIKLRESSVGDRRKYPRPENSRSREGERYGEGYSRRDDHSHERRGDGGLSAKEKRQQRW